MTINITQSHVHLGHDLLIYHKNTMKPQLAITARICRIDRQATKLSVNMDVIYYHSLLLPSSHLIIYFDCTVQDCCYFTLLTAYEYGRNNFYHGNQNTWKSSIVAYVDASKTVTNKSCLPHLRKCLFTYRQLITWLPTIWHLLVCNFCLLHCSNKSLQGIVMK